MEALAQIQVQQIYTKSPLRNFCYVIHDGKDALCVDPLDGDAMAAHLAKEGLTCKAIVNTHAHYDHIKGNSALAAATGAPIWCHSAAEIPAASARLSHGQKLSFTSDDSSTYVEVLDTPGHTMSHICLLVVVAGKPTALVAGDCLFNGGVGNCRNGGDPDALYATVRDVILGLPDDVVVYPGHDYLANNLQFALSIDEDLAEARELLAQYPQSDSHFIRADLALEKRISLFLRTSEEAVQQKIAAKSTTKGDGQDPSRDAFVALRALRDSW